MAIPYQTTIAFSLLLANYFGSMQGLGKGPGLLALHKVENIYRDGAEKCMRKSHSHARFPDFSVACYTCINDYMQKIFTKFIIMVI